MNGNVTRIGLLFVAVMLASCGGGGGDGNGGDNPGNSGAAAIPGRFEESDAMVSLSGAWSPANSNFGWSGGAAVESGVQGATATFTFTGTSVRWIGARSESSGIATVSVDGGPGKRVDLFARPNEIRTPIVTLDGLSPGKHTLTIRVTGEKHSEAKSNVVVVDAFDVEAPIVSHLQETDTGVVYSGNWTQDPSANWSGGGVTSAPHPPVGGARFTDTAGAKITLTFRGTSVTWQGGRGSDYGIALVSVDGGAATEVDTYSPSRKYQEVVFAATGLADGKHTLTIEATGRKNDASSGTRIVVDAFDVTMVGKRFQEEDPRITYTGKWTHDNINRVWSEGSCATSAVAGSRATFTFTGTGVSWIGCQKESCSGVAKVYIDGAFVQEIKNWKPPPIEAYQNETFRKDGLTPGVQHTLTIEQTINGGYIVVDAFDVRQ